jgi:hypothetical protein
LISLRGPELEGQRGGRSRERASRSASQRERTSGTSTIRTGKDSRVTPGRRREQALGSAAATAGDSRAKTALAASGSPHRLRAEGVGCVKSSAVRKCPVCSGIVFTHPHRRRFRFPIKDSPSGGRMCANDCDPYKKFAICGRDRGLSAGRPSSRRSATRCASASNWSGGRTTLNAKSATAVVGMSPPSESATYPAIPASRMEASRT